MTIDPAKLERQRAAHPSPRCRIYGEASPQAVLTEALVLEIRRLYGLGLGTRKIRAAIGWVVSETTVRSVVIGESWRHLPLTSKGSMLKTSEAA